MKLFKVVQRAVNLVHAKTWREYTNAIESLRKERDEARAQVADLKRANKVYRTGAKEDLDEFVAVRDERDKALAEIALCEARASESVRFDLLRTVCKERDDARAEVADLKAKLSVFTKPEDDAEALVALYRLKRNLGLSPDTDNQTVAAAQREALLRTAGKLAGAWTDEEAKEMFGSAEAPSEPNGRIDPATLPGVKVTHEPTGWYLVRFGVRGRLLFNAYGDFWAKDVRDATSFSSAEAATAYLRKQAMLNAATPGTVPPSELRAVPATCKFGPGWAVKRADGHLMPWLFTNEKAAKYFIANYVNGDDREAMRAAMVEDALVVGDQIEIAEA